jgi:hypothetical protein
VVAVAPRNDNNSSMICKVRQLMIACGRRNSLMSFYLAS